MEVTELLQLEAIEQKLRTWDWRADLKREERNIPWLARHTGKSERIVYNYAAGLTKPSLEWLRVAYKVIHRA